MAGEKAEATTAYDLPLRWRGSANPSQMWKLSEDLTFVQEASDGTRPPVSCALVWVASLLKFVSEKIVD